jgi:glycerol kinase
LFDIHRQCWDDELLALFRIPHALLPSVQDSSHFYGATIAELFGAPIPIAGVAGDQHAAMVGQACFKPGMVKSTYGTGCFALRNAGAAPASPRGGTLTTMAYRLEGVPTYASEGAIFIAGAAIKWLRDGLGLIRDAAETSEIATRLPGNHGVYMVPAFVGLGAPHWDPHARGLLCGLTLDSSAAHIVRAALESVAYQTLDLMEAMTGDVSLEPSGGSALRVDGGMAANDWFCQFLADILEAPVERPVMLEITAHGAAFLAGLSTGVYSDLAAISNVWARGARFEPRMARAERARLIEGWRDAVHRALSSSEAAR